MLLGLLFVVIATAIARNRYGAAIERRVLAKRPIGPRGIIIGADEIDLPRAGAPALLLLHGGGDTPQVMAALAAHLHANGFAVRAPLLSGHGRELRAFRSVSAAQWHADVEDAYAAMRAVHDWVGIVGLSVGGALAIRFAASHPEIPALVLLAPYVETPPPVRLAAALSSVWRLALPYISSRGGRSIRDPEAARLALGYGYFTPAALTALVHVVNDAKAALSSVSVPTLVVQSREDNRISVRAAEDAFASLGAREKRLVWIEGAGHVITVDYGHERVFALVSEWMRAHATSSAPSTSTTAKDPVSS